MTKTETDTYLKSIRLENFRCFASLEVEFHPRLTVISSINGGGKTALLDGIATALRPFVDTMDGYATSRGFERMDVRRILTSKGTMQTIVPSSIEAHAVFQGESVQWKRTITSERSTRTKNDASQLLDLTKQWIDALQEDAKKQQLRQFKQLELFKLPNTVWSWHKIVQISQKFRQHLGSRAVSDLMEAVEQGNFGQDDENRKTIETILDDFLRLGQQKELENFLTYLEQISIEKDETTIFCLPVISYYGTGRLWGQSKQAKQPRSQDIAINARVRGYTDGLLSSSHYKGFISWFRRFSYEAQQELKVLLEGDLSDFSISPHRPSLMLKGIQTAIDKVLLPVDTAHLTWDFAEDMAVVYHRWHGRLPVSALSDGIRTMIGLVGDIAYRTALLNPTLREQAPSQTPGIVLIDEIDMHLHPAWQQVILQTIQDAFPRIQFIVTTHSPQVLSTVASSSIRILHVDEGVGIATIPEQQTRGVESADILATVMNVSPVAPLPEAEWLRQYRIKIENNQAEHPEGMELRQRLEQHFGPKHPVLLDCDRLIRFFHFKQRNQNKA